MGPWLVTAGRIFDGVTDKTLERAYVVVDGTRSRRSARRQSWRVMGDVSRG